MQEPIKYCSYCGQQNYEGAARCHWCRASFLVSTTLGPKTSKKHPGLWVICGVLASIFFGAILLNDPPGRSAPVSTVTPADFATPSPSPTPVLSPAEHMAAAKKLLARPYNKDNYNRATIHLGAIPEEAKEYKEAARMIPKVAKRYQREEDANDPKNQLVVVSSNWDMSGFGSIAIWRVTFRNNSDRPIGDIQYRTLYFSETGNLVDKGGVDSLLDKKIIQKVIPPKSNRTIEVNDGFIHSKANRARFELMEWRFVADSR